MKIDKERLYSYLEGQGLAPRFAEDEEEILITCTTCDVPKLYVNADEGMWTCFVCDQHGGLFELLTQMIGLSATEAFLDIRKLKVKDPERGTFTTPWFDGGRPPRREVKVKWGTVPLPSEMISFRMGELGPASKPYREYLARRGVGVGVAADYGMGYCPTGRYRHRIIIPIEHGGVLYTFVARSIYDRCCECNLASEAYGCNHYWRKVLYPSGSHPSAVLFNADKVRGEPLIIVEGVFDALRLSSRAVALLGSSLSARQAAIVQGLRPNEVIVCLDGDKEGRTAARGVAKKLVSMLPLTDIRIADLPDGHDPASAPWSTLSGALDKAWSFVYR